MKGQIGLSTIVGWGLMLALGVTGVFWAKIGMTDAQVDGVKTEQAQTLQRVAIVEEAVRTIKTDKADIKQLLKQTK